VFEIPKEIEKELEEKGGWESIKQKLLAKDIKKMEKIIKAIADERRLRILYALSKQKMCVCMLVDLMDCSYSKCSYHISKLKEAGLIKANKKENFIVYSLTSFGRRIIKDFERSL